MQNRLDSSRSVKPHEVESVCIIEGVWRQRSVEQWDVGNLADEDDTEEEGDGAQDGGLEEAHLEGLRGVLVTSRIARRIHGVDNVVLVGVGIDYSWSPRDRTGRT
jgi:hypothetical protein